MPPVSLVGSHLEDGTACSQDCFFLINMASDVFRVVKCVAKTTLPPSFAVVGNKATTEWVSWEGLGEEADSVEH